jgi:hypothetical protein
MNDRDFDSKFEEIVENNPSILQEQIFIQIYKKTFWWSIGAILLLVFTVLPLAFIIGVPLLINLAVIFVVRIEKGLEKGILYCLVQYLGAKFLTFSIIILMLFSVIFG